MPKVCIVTCYKDPDYVRARTLRAALRADADNEVIIIKNKHRSLLRYPEVTAKLLKTRFKSNPDIYLLTFRGYELQLAFNLITIGKRRIFDEFINLVEWAVYEHRKIRASSAAHGLLYIYYRGLLRHSDIILTDTEAHAAYSARLMQLPASKFKAIPVSTDETVFRPRPAASKAGKHKFQVFYYGNMLPLHGLQYVLEAALLLANDPGIYFLLVGGGQKAEVQVAEARRNGAHVSHKTWVPFEELPNLAAHSNLCLGGPFGGTLQANMVITGKTYQFLAMGLPTLVGETDAAPELVDGKNCLAVPQANAEALAEKVSWASKNPAALRRIGRDGYQTYRSHYSNEAVKRLMEGIIHSLS